MMLDATGNHADKLPGEMSGFLRWFETPGDLDPLLIPIQNI